MAEVEQLGRRQIFAGRVVQLEIERLRLQNGRVCELELVRHPGAAAVVPLLPNGEVVLVRQYRHATGGWLLEVPAGKLDPGESPETCARREVEEETGYRPEELLSLGWIWTSPGFCDEKIWLFLARELKPARQELQHDEMLTVERRSLAEAVSLAASGEISDAKSVCALLRVAGRLARP